MEDEAELEKLQDLIERYLFSSPPIYWVNWVGRCRDIESKTKLESVLFENGRLRSLTDPVVREEVLHVIAGSESLMEIVAEDFVADVEQIRREQDEK